MIENREYVADSIALIRGNLESNQGNIVCLLVLIAEAVL